MPAKQNRYRMPDGGFGQHAELASAVKEFLDRPSRFGYLQAEVGAVRIQLRIRPSNPRLLIGLLNPGVDELSLSQERALLAAGWHRGRTRPTQRTWAMPVDLFEIADCLSEVRQILAVPASSGWTFVDRRTVQARYRWWRDPDALGFWGLAAIVLVPAIVLGPALVAWFVASQHRPALDGPAIAVIVATAIPAGLGFGLALDRALAALAARRRLPSPASTLSASPTVGALLWAIVIASIVGPR